MRQDRIQLGFMDYAAMVWQRRRAALLAAGLFACVTLVAFNCMPRRYSATAVFERQGDVVAAHTDKMLPASFATFKPILSFELTGPGAVRTALEQVGYADRLPKDAAGEPTLEAQAQLTRTAERISRNLHLKWLVNSPHLDTVAVSLSNSDPALTGSLVNQLVNNYIERTRQTLLSQLGDSSVFLAERIEAGKTRSSELRARLRDFLAQHPNMTPENPQKLTEQIRAIEVELDDLQQQRKDLELRLGLLTEQAQSAPDARTMTACQEMARRLAEYRDALAKAQNLRGMTERHPKVIQLQRSIAEARRQLEDLQAGSPGGPSSPTAVALEDAQSALRRVDGLILRRRQQHEALREAQANALPVIDEYERINGAIEEVEEEIALWQRSRATVQMALDAERNGTRTHLQMVKSAGPVSRPVWPALWHVFFIALMGGAGTGVLTAVGLTRLSRRFVSPADAAAGLDLPLLGVVGPILSPARRRLEALRRYVLVPAGVCLLMLVMVAAAAGVVLASRYPSQYVQLRQQLMPTAWAGLRQMLGAG